jgi:hypothetical protein
MYRHISVQRRHKHKLCLCLCLWHPWLTARDHGQSAESAQRRTGVTGTVESGRPPSGGPVLPTGKNLLLPESLGPSGLAPFTGTTATFRSTVFPSTRASGHRGQTITKSIGESCEVEVYSCVMLIQFRGRGRR